MTRTTRRLQWTLVLGLSGVLVCGSTAIAQDSGSSSSSGSYPGSSSGSGSYPGGSSSSGGYPGGSSSGGAQAGGAGSVSNESMDATTVTTTTTGTEFEAVDDTAPLPNTGGEPLLMAMIGSIMAGSALLLRRKLS